MKILPKNIPAIFFLFFFSLQGKSQQTRDYAKCNLQDLLSNLYKQDKTESTFLSETTLIGKIMQIKKKEKLDFVSTNDEVLYVIQGKGKLMTENNVLLLDKDTIVFIPGNMHYYLDDEDSSLTMLRLISMENKSQKDLVPAIFSLGEIEKQRIAAENAWNPFLKRKSMTFGLYMLPKLLHGDSALVHRWDEVNLITSGFGKFQVGQEIMDVQPGDIIYVRKGNPHFFHSLLQDLDILIFFEKRSVQE